MNTEHLYSLAQRLSADDAEFSIQRDLVKLQSALQNVINQPQDGAQQQAFAKAFELVKRHVSDMTSQYPPALLNEIENIGGRLHFTTMLVERINSQILVNTITPAVLLEDLNKIISERAEYLNGLRQVTAGFDSLGLEEEEIDSDEAEIGFKVPRVLFENILDGLISELRAINLIIQAFSENVTGKKPIIEVKSISTSDPTFFFSTDIATIISIGTAITWCLNTWKQLEEIRRIRSETRKLNLHSEEEIKTLFDDKIAQRIDDRIEEKLTELAGEKKQTAGRAQEVRNGLSLALRSLLARIERGMTVEIRFLPAPQAEEDDDEAEDQALVDPLASVREQLDSIVSQLNFPAPSQAPLLQVPSQSEPPSRSVQRAPRKAEGK